MATKVATRPAAARWNNTGGDIRVHLVPAGTHALDNPTQEEVWTAQAQVVTPLCGAGIFHGSWTIGRQSPPPPPLKLCERCFDPSAPVVGSAP